MDKPIYSLVSARIKKQPSTGVFYILATNVDNPRCKIGGWITTSPILNINLKDRKVETWNSIYLVDEDSIQSWKDIPGLFKELLGILS